MLGWHVASLYIAYVIYSNANSLDKKRTEIMVIQMLHMILYKDRLKQASYAIKVQTPLKNRQRNVNPAISALLSWRAVPSPLS